MQCPECRLCGHHAPGCAWGADLGERYARVLNLLEAWRGTGDTNRLREAVDALNELTAWASAYEVAKKQIREAWIG